MVQFADPGIVEDGEYPSMTIGDVEVPGIYDVSESGGGFTEKYKTEYEDRAGGEDEADEPPAAQMTVRAVATDETWEALNNLREQREPFSVGIGEFTYAEMGITDLQRTMSAENPQTNWIQIQMQEFREIVIAQATVTVSASDSLLSALSGGGGGPGGGGGGSAGGPGDPAGELGSGTASPNNAEATGDLAGDGSPTSVPANGNPVHNVGAGEVMGNWHFDITASGASAQVVPTGGGWVVRDIGWEGMLETHDALIGPNFSGSDSIISNIYQGDGGIDQHTGPTGIWVNRSSTGQLTIEHHHAQDFGDNGIYASAPGGSAQIHIRQSFGRNNAIANFRLARGTIQDSTTIHDSDFSRSNTARAVWVWQPGPVEITGTNIDGGPQQGLVAGESGAATVNVSDSQVAGTSERAGSTINMGQGTGSNPDHTPPPVPTSPSQAANGEMSE